MGNGSRTAGHLRERAHVSGAPEPDLRRAATFQELEPREVKVGGPKVPGLDDTAPPLLLCHARQAAPTFSVQHRLVRFPGLSREVPIGKASCRFVHVEVPIERHASQGVSLFDGWLVYQHQLARAHEEDGVASERAPFPEGLCADASRPPL
ncbi:unnamed protein product [Polarella glacialis]|uniref:Uncharacterized protein n=1 Tax=Polarella glacialis TaxID=89957 RepID=A0A813DDJ5_POLGL|nr:unnamed protein product [Polarella glacialis]